MTFLLVREDREYLCSPGEELHTDLGILTVPEDVTPGDTIETHLGTPFSVHQLRNRDLFHHFERTGAPLLPRDIGLIIGLTNVQSNDTVLDAGTGTGVLAAFLGRIGATVLTYERNPEFAQVARNNMEMAGLSEIVTVRTEDILDAVSSITTMFDVITLDMENADAIVSHADRLLRPRGSICVYSPFVEAARSVALTAESHGLSNISTYETIQREMEFDDRGSRPTTRGVGHTGYLTLARNPPTPEATD